LAREVNIAGKPVVMVLCGLHYRVLIESDEAARLARAWAA